MESHIHLSGWAEQSSHSDINSKCLGHQLVKTWDLQWKFSIERVRKSQAQGDISVQGLWNDNWSAKDEIPNLMTHSSAMAKLWQQQQLTSSNVDFCNLAQNPRFPDRRLLPYSYDIYEMVRNFPCLVGFIIILTFILKLQVEKKHCENISSNFFIVFSQVTQQRIMSCKVMCLQLDIQY